MELGSLFLILALLVLVVLFITRPFLAKEESPSNAMTNQVDHERSNLLAEYDRVLAALQELDLDFALGKIPEEAYPPQRSVLVMRGVEVLRKLDTMYPLPEGKNSTIASATLNNISMLERSISQNVQTPILISDGENPMGEAVSAVNLTEAFPDDDLELLLANRRRVRQEKSTGFCAMCGDPVRKSDRYCPKCGARIG
jgi:NADH pyrophosphatase NudC (nudix superfamily)